MNKECCFSIVFVHEQPREDTKRQLIEQSAIVSGGRKNLESIVFDQTRDTDRESKSHVCVCESCAYPVFNQSFPSYVTSVAFAR